MADLGMSIVWVVTPSGRLFADELFAVRGSVTCDTSMIFLTRIPLNLACRHIMASP